MADPTKACSLTQEEVLKLIAFHGYNLNMGSIEERMERLNYLHKRLKAFNDVGDNKSEDANAANQAAVTAPAAQAWGAPSNG